MDGKSIGLIFMILGGIFALLMGHSLGIILGLFDSTWPSNPMMSFAIFLILASVLEAAES